MFVREEASALSERLEQDRARLAQTLEDIGDAKAGLERELRSCEENVGTILQHQ